MKSDRERVRLRAWCREWGYFRAWWWGAPCHAQPWALAWCHRCCVLGDKWFVKNCLVMVTLCVLVKNNMWQRKRAFCKSLSSNPRLCLTMSLSILSSICSWRHESSVLMCSDSDIEATENAEKFEAFSAFSIWDWFSKHVVIFNPIPPLKDTFR